MTMWNRLLATLDQMFGFSNKVSSKVKKLQQGFDNRTQEHVIWFEYRIKVRDAQPPRPDPRVFEAKPEEPDPIVVKVRRHKRMRHLRELVDEINRMAAARESQD